MRNELLLSAMLPICGMAGEGVWHAAWGCRTCSKRAAKHHSVPSG